MDITIPKLLYPLDERGTTRTFSITTSPNTKDHVAFATRMSESAFKKTMMELPIGTEITAGNPGGQFVFPKEATNPLVFIAGGIGVTPFMSLARFAAEEKLPHKITMIYSNRSPESAVYLSELHELAKQNPNFKLIENYGPLTVDVLKANNLEAESLFYIAGPPGMVGMSHTTLSGLGISDDNIIIEEFEGYKS